jgi:localization factor PodJL
MSKAHSRNSSDHDDATRAGVRRAAPREGKGFEDWSDEGMRSRAQAESRSKGKGEARSPALSLSPESEAGLAEIARRLQRRRAVPTHDGLAQSLADAGRRLAEARSQSRERESLDDIATLRQAILELRRMTETAGVRRSLAFNREIEELLALLDDRIDAQRRAGVPEALLAPANDIARQLRLAVSSLDPATAIRDVRAALDEIVRRLGELGGPNSASSVAIKDLSPQIDGLRDQVARLSEYAPLSARFEAGLVELARHVCALAESGALAQSRYARELGALSRSVAELVAAETDRGVAALRSQMAELFADVGDALDRAGQKNLVEMDARLRVLGESLSQSLSRQLDDSLSRNVADTTKLHSLTEALAQKIDAALTETTAENDKEAFVQSLKNIESRICEPQFVDLVGRLDAMHAALTQSVKSEQANPQAELAQQIEQLAVRIERVLDVQKDEPSLSGLATQIEKLATRLDLTHEQTLKMAETIARQAGEAAAQSTLKNGKTEPQAAEQRETRETLCAVHEWLVRIGDRFATVEGAVRQLQELQTRTPPRVARTPEATGFVVPPAETSIPTPVVEALAIPMAAETAAVDTRTTQAGFIAAARRAAQQAARGQWLHDAQPPRSSEAAQNEGRFAGGIAAQKRPALIALGAIMLLAGAYQLTQNASLDDAPPMTIARDTAAPVQKEPVANVANTRSATSKQASAVDPAPVGAIVTSGQSGIAASMNSAMALATLAANGDPAAQFELASRYADGRDIARDFKLAVLWFEKAAQQGLAPAQYRLGTLYEKGLGVERNTTLARDFYQRAANAGNVRAMHNLAVMLAEGGDGKPDYAAAAIWFRKAAELGVRDSQYNLAILYARGLGVDVSLVQSYLWFSAAAAQGDVDAAKKRDEVAARLGARDLEAAKALAAGFRAKTPVPAANDVATPPGGWRAPAPTPARTTGKPKMSWFQSF